MNKIHIYLLVTLFAVAACNDKNDNKGFVIEGTVSGYSNTDPEVIMYNNNINSPVTYKADVKDGKFILRGYLDTPEIFTIRLNGVRDSLNLFIENNIITIKGVAEDFGSAMISGAKTNELVSEHREELENMSINYNISKLISAYDSVRNTDAGVVIENKIKLFNKKCYLIDSIFIEKHPGSFYSIMLLAGNADKFPPDYIKSKVAYYKQLPDFEENRYYKELDNFIKEINYLTDGSYAPDFTFRDTTGDYNQFQNVISRNKITMLYFWAGWCDACRKYNGFINSFYMSFKWRGFDIVGISLDHSKEDLYNAVAQDKITWFNYTELKGWKSVPAGKYKIEKIPTVILIDSAGKIISYDTPKKRVKQIIRERLLSPLELQMLYRSVNGNDSISSGK